MMTATSTAHALRAYTERTFTIWINDIINLAKTGDVDNLEDQLDQLSHVAAAGSIADFLLFVATAANTVKNGKEDKDHPLVWPNAADITTDVKDWYKENNKPGFQEENPLYLKKNLSELTETELVQVVQHAMAGKPCQDDIDLYDRVIASPGAPDFIDVPLGTDLSVIINHIKRWHRIYQHTEVKPDPTDQPALTDVQKLAEKLKAFREAFNQLLLEVKDTVDPSDENANRLKQSANRMNEATMWACQALFTPVTVPVAADTQPEKDNDIIYV